MLISDDDIDRFKLVAASFSLFFFIGIYRDYEVTPFTVANQQYNKQLCAAYHLRVCFKTKEIWPVGHEYYT